MGSTPTAAALNDYGAQLLTFVSPGMDYTKGTNAGLPLMAFHEAIFIIALYCFIVFFGYQFMRGRQANSVLRPFQYIYNAVQVGACGYLVVQTARVALALNYQPICNTFDPQAADNEMPQLLYLFYLTKALDFFDTLFIVFHKKDKQLSFLHVYHHCTIFVVYWINANIFYSGDIYYTIVANGSVHFVMYGYYLASMFKSVDQKGKGTGLVFALTQAVRPWITSMQLLQFVTMMAQASYMLWFSCGSPMFWTKIYFGYIVSLFGLFMHFFRQNYMQKGSKTKKATKTTAVPDATNIAGRTRSRKPPAASVRGADKAKDLKGE